MNEIMITNKNGRLTVSSLQVATDFGKQHKDVLEKITALRAENSAVTSMFVESAYKAGTGKNYKSYEITRDGFSLLVMGFTGKKALEWKLKYIEAFNLMEQKLRNSSAVNIEEIIAKAVTAAVAETVKAVIPLMTMQSPPLEQPKRIRKKYRYTTPSKISTLPPELREQVDEMIMSGEYSCRQIANYIENNSGIGISQISVNRYKRNNFYETEKSPTLAVEQVKEKWCAVSDGYCFGIEEKPSAFSSLGTYIQSFGIPKIVVFDDCGEE